MTEEMLEELKLMLGDAAANYSDALIKLCLKQSTGLF